MGSSQSHDFEDASLWEEDPEDDRDLTWCDVSSVTKKNVDLLEKAKVELDSEGSSLENHMNILDLSLFIKYHITSDKSLSHADNQGKVGDGTLSESESESKINEDIGEVEIGRIPYFSLRGILKKTCFRAEGDLCYSRISRGKGFNSVKKALSQGIPVLFSYNVYESFDKDETYETGLVIVPMESEIRKGVRVGLLTGYDEDVMRFTCVGGRSRIMYFSYEYIENYSCDFWILDKKSNG